MFHWLIFLLFIVLGTSEEPFEVYVIVLTGETLPLIMKSDSTVAYLKVHYLISLIIFWYNNDTLTCNLLET
jgi:hypothetical protein